MNRGPKPSILEYILGYLTAGAIISFILLTANIIKTKDFLYSCFFFGVLTFYFLGPRR